MNLLELCLLNFDLPAAELTKGTWKLSGRQKIKGFVLPCFYPALICTWRWDHSRVWMPRALAWTPESGQACFPLTQAANPSTSPASRAAVSPLLLRLFQFYWHMAAFFRLVGRDGALLGHTLHLFPVVSEQATAGFPYWLNPPAPWKLKNITTSRLLLWLQT